MKQTEPEPAQGGQSLPADQEKALAALLTCRTIGSAAKKAGVTPRTLHRWLNDPVFRQAYLAARRMALEQATSALQRASAAAVSALEKNLKCGIPTAEIAAAKAILDYGFKGLETEDFDARLAALEAAQETA